MEQSFYERFDLKSNLEEGKKKFINRVNLGIFHKIRYNIPLYLELRSFTDLQQFLCEELGYDYKFYSNCGLEGFTLNDFQKTLHILELLILKSNGRFDFDGKINEYLEKSIVQESIDLGIRYNNGIFIPKGNELFDNILINETLSNIKGFIAEKYYKEALQKYFMGDKKGATSASYEAVEKLSQELLKNEKGLKENKKDIQKLLGDSSLFSEYWSKIIENIYNYYCDSRHTKKDTDNNTLDDIETEAIIYQTGLVINLIIQKFKE